MTRSATFLTVLCGISALILAGILLFPRVTPYRLYTVTTGSMVPTIPVGSIVIVDTSDHHIESGEIVAFRPPLAPTQVFMHRVHGINPNGSFSTKGDALPGIDPWTVSPGDIVGREVGIIPNLAWFIAVLRVTTFCGLIAFGTWYLVLRFLNYTIPTFALVSIVSTISLVYLFNVEKPLIGADVSFTGVTTTAVHAYVINYGWMPLEAFSEANPHDRSPHIEGNSVRHITFRIPNKKNILKALKVDLVPALHWYDWCAFWLLITSPLLAVLGYRLIVNERKRFRHVLNAALDVCDIFQLHTVYHAPRNPNVQPTTQSHTHTRKKLQSASSHHSSMNKDEERQ